MYKEILLLIFCCWQINNSVGQTARLIRQTTNTTADAIADNLIAPVSFLPKTFIQQKKLRIHQRNGGKAISNKDLPCDCHVQGLGWYADNQQLVLTCQDLCSEKKGAFIMLYNEKELLPIDVQKGKSNAFFNHPSAIQISNGIFPVALAATKKQDSYIDFYQIEYNQLKLRKGARITVKDRHIGALAFANIDSINYLIGVGWDAADLTIWKATTNNSLKFEEHYYTTNSRQLLTEKEKKEWGPYNSLWLGEMDEGSVVLIATHGKGYQNKSHLDIWEIVDLKDKQPSLRLLSSKKLNGKTKAGINYFLEGVTVKTNSMTSDYPILLAAPHDFTTKNCPTGYRCSNTIYEIR